MDGNGRNESSIPIQNNDLTSPEDAIAPKSVFSDSANPEQTIPRSSEPTLSKIQTCHEDGNNSRGQEELQTQYPNSGIGSDILPGSAAGRSPAYNKPEHLHSKTWDGVGTRQADLTVERDKGEPTSLIQRNVLQGDEGRYATKKLLARYIPEADPEDERALSRIWSSKRSTVLGFQQFLAYLTAAVTISVMVWAIKSYPPSPGGIGTIFAGSCSTVQTADTLLHLGLNNLSTLFLGTGNFCLQLLAAPSVREVRTAHKKGKSLDIGVPSIRNLWYVKRTRVALWLAIGFTSSVLHLL